jgi:cyclopropane-fatty-acyl-phospholipid synthase
MIETARRLMSVFDDRRAAETMRDLLQRAGITVGGDAPWDIQIHDPRVYARALRDGTLGVGESYVEGWWDCPAIDQMFERITRAQLDVVLSESWVMLANAVKARVLNLQARRAFEVGQRHYDIGNDLYQAMLDRRMVYTCAYWKNADNLDAAQEAKLDLICRKIGAGPGMRILDLGCGWGGFAAYAAEKYGASVVGYTVSREQWAWARERHAKLPVEIRLDDYRKATGQFDAVVSIGLMEHVGTKNYRAYMEQAVRCLNPGGIVLIHTIGGQEPRAQIDPWYHKHIFPNAVIPTLGQLTSAMDEILVIEDVHNIGPDYDRTLMAWWENFERAWPTLRAHYGEPFYRMWKFYLMTSAAQFRARALNLFQIVATTIGTAQPKTARSS